MKLAVITPLYKEYIDKFRGKNAILEYLSYNQLFELLNTDSFGWGNIWDIELKPYGIETQTFYPNVEWLQKKWVQDYMPKNKSISTPNILFEQLNRFKPDLLWYTDWNAELLIKIKENIPSIKKIFGWSGSAVLFKPVYNVVDFVISCANEAVDYFINNNKRAYVLQHGFNPSIIKSLAHIDNKKYPLSFIGQLIVKKDFHANRYEFLNSLLREKLPLHLFSGSFEYKTTKSKKKIREILSKYLTIDITSTNTVLAKNTLGTNNPPIFGLDMYKIIKQSELSLNIHAESSINYASNRRLWEICGIGACMVTDYKDNLKQMFDTENEIVTYRDSNELVSKCKWLLDNPSEILKIAKAGQNNVLKNHTYKNRAENLMEIINKELNK